MTSLQKNSIIIYVDTPSQQEMNLIPTPSTPLRVSQTQSLASKEYSMEREKQTVTLQWRNPANTTLAK